MKNFLDKFFSRSKNLDYISQNLKQITLTTPANKIFEAINNFSEKSEIRYVGGCVRKVIKKKIINLNHQKIRSICDLVGSDVILGTISSNCVLSSDGRIKKINDAPKYYSTLVKPDFGCSTKKIYSAVRKYTKSKYNKPKKNMFGVKYLIDQQNALETIALKKYPKLKKIKLFLESINNPLFVRMTGSGSTIVAYYNSLKSCKLAKAKFKRKYKNYWCVTAKTI